MRQKCYLSLARLNAQILLRLGEHRDRVRRGEMKSLILVFAFVSRSALRNPSTQGSLQHSHEAQRKLAKSSPLVLTRKLNYTSTIDVMDFT
jgi:hypothetical protein